MCVCVSVYVRGGRSITLKLKTISAPILYFGEL